MEPDYYEVLQVARDASREEIKASYRLAVRQHHPDAAPAEFKEAAHEKIQLIIAAWTILSDAVSRAAYDKRRRNVSQYPLSPTGSSGPDGASHAHGHGQPGRRAADQPEDGRKRSRVQAVMGGSSSPRPANPRTRLLAMVFDAAQLYHVEGRAEEAARVCQNVLRADPTNAEAAVLLSDIYASQNQRAAALDLLERALRLQPSNALYRSKWEALRHTQSSSPTSPQPHPPTPSPVPRASAPNPWGKPVAPSPLSSRISERAPEARSPQTPELSGSPQAQAARPIAAQEIQQPNQAQAMAPAIHGNGVQEDSSAIPASLSPQQTVEGVDAAPVSIWQPSNEIMAPKPTPAPKPDPEDPTAQRSSLLQRLRSRLTR